MKPGELALDVGDDRQQLIGAITSQAGMRGFAYRNRGMMLKSGPVRFHRPLSP
jgi:hypothetical protein